MPFSSGDYYRRLHLSPEASRQDIKAAFRRLARLHHPEVQPNHPNALQQFKALREAYEVLVDRVRRERYDQCQQGDGDDQALTHPQRSEDFYLRGVRYLLSRRYRAALGDYSQAIELDDQFAEAYLRRAEVRYLLEDDSGVLADCSRAIALNSTEARTYFYQGMARYRLDYVQSAIAAFTDAITCDPEDAQYYYRRGLAYQDLRQIDEAAVDLRRAAQLYRSQGQLSSYRQLMHYLRQFGTAGRSRPIKFLGGVAQRLTNVIPGQKQGGRGGTNVGRRASDASLKGNHIPRTFSSGQFSSGQMDQKPSVSTSNPSSRPVAKSAHRHHRHNSDSPQTGNAADRRRRWMKLSEQAYWAPGVSSRPDDEVRSRRRWLNLSGFTATLKLLSNPAGEMIPLYYRLSSRQTSLVGYGLAVLANLLFVLGGIHHTVGSSWQIASQLWAAGGLMFVAMVLVVALTRLKLHIRSLWAADMFILGTAMVPLGMLSVASALAQHIASQQAASAWVWLVTPALLLATLWAMSQSLITLYSGFSRIHVFSEKFAAWFAPTVLALGLLSGVGTWSFLAL